MEKMAAVENVSFKSLYKWISPHMAAGEKKLKPDMCILI